MSIQFIPNQPMRFLSAKFDDQACINKDLRAYSVLNQPGDPVCVQVKQLCVGNIACLNSELSNELAVDPDFDNGCGVDWTCGTDWAMAGGQATYSASGNDGEIYQDIASIDVGEQYCIEVDIDSNDTGFDVDIYVGGRRIGQIGANATGSNKVYGEAGPTTRVLLRLTNDYASAASGTLVLNSFSVKQIAFCNQFNTSSKEYVTNGDFSSNPTSQWEIGTGWSWSGTDMLHATPAATASLAQNIPEIGHRDAILFSFTLGSRTAGTVGMYYGDTLMASSSANGVTSVNYPAFGLGDDDLEFRPTGGFDGYVDDVSATETRAGWSFDPVTGFCHTPGWTNAFYSTESLTVGEFYFIQFQITMNNGSVYLECGGQVIGTFTKSGVYSKTFTALTTDQYKFTPSSDFDGCIAPVITICQIDNDVQFRLIYQNGDGATDWHTASSSQDQVRYDGLYVSWCLTSLADALSGGVGVALPYSCYYVQVTDGETTWTSDNLIDYRASWSCTKRIRAWCDGEALGFQFGDNGDFFTLVERFSMLYMNPVYPIEGEDYLYSTGTFQRVYAERRKAYEMLFDYMNEYAHDTVSAMVVCDIMEIDGVEYIVPFKDYEPQWAERGKYNLAQVSIEVQRRQTSVIFNRNC